jgi:hypothetical protein
MARKSEIEAGFVPLYELSGLGARVGYSVSSSMAWELCHSP